MCFVEVVPHVRQIFAADVECVDMVEVTGRQYQSVARDGLTSQRRLNFIFSYQFGKRAHAQAFGPCHAAIVLERLFARRLGAGADERVIADLEALGGREEGHVDGIAHDRIRQGARVDHEGVDPTAFGRDGTGEADRPRAGDDDGFVLHGIANLVATFDGRRASDLS